MARKVIVSLISNKGLDQVPCNLESMITHLNGKLEQVLPDAPDIIVLPEVCDRCVALSDAEQQTWYLERGTRILEFLSQVAKENRCYIVYSAVRHLPEDTSAHPFRNSTQIIGRDGKVVGIYDKNHLVPYEYDDRGIAYGTEAPVFELDFGKVACVICFDLNFNSLLERYAEQKPELILFSSLYHGGVKQIEWASRCKAYFAGAIENDQSRVIDAFGNLRAGTTNYQDFVTTTINLDYEIVHLDENQEKIVAAKKKYGSALTVYDPGHYGCVMLTYEAADQTALDVVREFDILELDDYFTGCLTHRKENI